MATPTAIVAGNWKMNGVQASIEELKSLQKLLEIKPKACCDILICPPFTLLTGFAAVSGEMIAIGAQDCHTATSGAHTGDISAGMIADAGAGYVIVGHSERRSNHGETSDLVASKATAAQSADLKAIICVGESEAERDAGKTLSVVLDQLTNSIPETATAQNTVIAYEPVWAIGTGRTPTPQDVADVHAAIRASLQDRFGKDGAGVPILYGGSVKPSNALELMAVENVDGALVGGASLKATDFDGIIDAYRK